MKEQTACFSGHREIPSEDVDIIMERLNKIIVELIEQGYTGFCCGGALGFDTIAAQIILELKKTYKQIELILHLPCLTQSKGWSETDIKIYNRIKDSADKVIYTSESYTRGCMHKRNRSLVDNSNICICYLTHNSGGTYYTVNYAKKKIKGIINIATLECNNCIYCR